VKLLRGTDFAEASRVRGMGATDRTEGLGGIRMTDTQSTERSPMVAYLLWFFLGGFGAHRFYCGRKGSGFGMLGLMVGSMIGSLFIVGLIGLAALFCWWVVDAFMIGKWLNDSETEVLPAEMQPPISQAA
jgi:TM2 domain-containing membrane protein YozV